MTYERPEGKYGYINMDLDWAFRWRKKTNKGNHEKRKNNLLDIDVLNLFYNRCEVMDDHQIIKSVSDCDYVRTIGALTVVLELTMRKMKEIREKDGRPHHVAALGHIRTALDYERKVLSELNDPKSMAALSSDFMREVLGMQLGESVKLLEGK